ncbi:hypothetical protein F2P81_009498 [Scophthalmus maximus]|uniref:Integrase catalytic domain-containing protein n=1 Tax=Scophthalmus maximus TaxID=52904 RepID=A0A6A4T742_SCOMX|nr:hypothetical protein F2P81_009498 [Scophthalmus maximus]
MIPQTPQVGGAEAPLRPSDTDLEDVVAALLLLSLRGQDNLHSFEVNTCGNTLQEPVGQANNPVGKPESSDPNLVSMKQLIKVQHSDQAVHKHLSLRPEVQLEMTLVQEHHTNLQEQIQAPQPRVEGDPEEGHTSKVSIAACTAIQEPQSVPNLKEMSSSGLTSRHLLHDALQPMEQMNLGYQETHASSLVTPAGEVSHFVSSDDHQASPPACLVDMGAPQPRDAHPPIFSPTSLRFERRKEDCCQLECTTRVHSARGYEVNANILVPGNIALDGDDRPRVKRITFVTKIFACNEELQRNQTIHGPTDLKSLLFYSCDQRVTLHCRPSNLNMQKKSDTVLATEKFVADTVPYGKVKCFRSDNGTEFTRKVFQTLLIKNATRHQTSAPYSPHQNGTAERNWRTHFDIERCMLIEVVCPNNCGLMQSRLLLWKCDENLGIQAYIDANWAGDINDRRSTTGYCVSLIKGRPLVSLKTKKQPTVALSTCEAEYIALAATIQECLYLTQLLDGIDKYLYALPKLYEDNQGTIALAKNPVSRQRCKHMDIKYHFIRSTVNDGKVLLEYCPTDQMVADLMTKPATKFKLVKFAKFMFGDN